MGFPDLGWGVPATAQPGPALGCRPTPSPPVLTGGVHTGMVHAGPRVHTPLGHELRHVPFARHLPLPHPPDPQLDSVCQAPGL